MINKNDSPLTNPLGYAGKIDDAVFGRRVYLTFLPTGQDDFVLPGGTKWVPDAVKKAQIEELGKFLDPVDGALSRDAIRSLRLLNIAANIQRSTGKMAYVVVKAQVVHALSRARLRERFNCVVSLMELAGSLP
jgi:hypothetical protein